MELEREREARPEIEERHLILIAAAVATMVGSRFRILDIHPANESIQENVKTPRPYPGEAARIVLRRPVRLRVPAAPKEAKREAAHHA